MQDFWKDSQFKVIDARRGGYPCALVHEEAKTVNKRRRPSKRWEWENCQILAGNLNVKLSHSEILFLDEATELWLASASSTGKMYGFKNNPTSCYEALLSLQRDRLARLSDDEAISAGQSAKECLC